MMSSTVLLRLPLAAVALIVGVLILPTPAQAHTDFDYSLPTDGVSVGEPVGEITVAFTLPVTLVGNGFAVLDPQNNERAPLVVTDDETVFRLQLDPPLAGGTVAVKYEVRAEDGHVLTGNFVFDVDVPAATTAPPTSAAVPTAPPSTVQPTTSPAGETTTTVASAAEPVSTTTTTATTPAGAIDEVAVAAPDAIGDMPTDLDGGGSGAGVFIAIAAAVALGAAGFVLVRSRTSGT